MTEGWIGVSEMPVKDNTEATIIGWHYARIGYMTNIHKTMKVEIVEMDTCRKELESDHFKSDKQMCGVPMNENQSIMQVIHLMNSVNSKRFCTYIFWKSIHNRKKLLVRNNLVQNEFDLVPFIL